ncbi:MAG: hypothetical protein LBH06_04860 [Rikenellaceae bacterium]|nr:hypothetical protein [Rikenellaceae bacterium]
MPEARVVWNDFDNFAQRLAAIPQTNELVAQIGQAMGDSKYKGRLPLSVCRNITGIITDHASRCQYVDHLTLSAILLFSGNYADSVDAPVRSANNQGLFRWSFPRYDTTGYLEGARAGERRLAGYCRRICRARRRAVCCRPSVCYYRYIELCKDTFQSITSYLDAFNVLRDNSFIYFTSEKSGITDIFNWFERRFGYTTPLSGAKLKTLVRATGAGNRYTDMMYYIEK